MNNILESETIKLRAVEPSDAETIHQWENNPENWHLSGTTIPYSLHIMRKYAESATDDIYEAKQLRLIIEKKENSRAIGAIDLYDFDPYNSRAGIGILVHDKNERHNGFAFEAIVLIKRYAFEYLHMKQLYATIPLTNTPSVKLFEKAGFIYSGTKKQWLRTADGWLDEVIYQHVNPKA